MMYLFVVVVVVVVVVCVCQWMSVRVVFCVIRKKKRISIFRNQLICTPHHDEFV